MDDLKTTYRGWTVPIDPAHMARSVRPAILKAINRHAALIVRGARPRRIKRAYKRCQRRIEVASV